MFIYFLYMFRAYMCPSSGEITVSMRHLVIVTLYGWLSRTVTGSIPGGVTGEFFRGFRRQNHVPWGRLGLWKWVPGISSGVRPAGAYGWRPTTLQVPNVEKIRGLNLPGTPWATSACCGTQTKMDDCLVCRAEWRTCKSNKVEQSS